MPLCKMRRIIVKIQESIGAKKMETDVLIELINAKSFLFQSRFYKIKQYNRFSNDLIGKHIPHSNPFEYCHCDCDQAIKNNVFQ